jgi:outer membrane biogenesis lipoprotein LolB
MKRINLFVFSLLILITIIFINSTQAQTKNKPQQMTSEEKEVMLISSLAKQGYLSYSFDDKGFYVLIEPLFWQKALHREKVELVRAAMQTARFLNKQKNINLRTIMFFNITTHEELAHGFISGINPGKIEIIK